MEFLNAPKTFSKDPYYLLAEYLPITSIDD